MDALTLDGLLAEIRPLIVGRHVARLRGAEAQAVLLEISGARGVRLWLDAGRATAGLYPLTREQARAAQDESAMAGRSRQAVLLFRKHLEGRRLTSLRRVPGERVVVLEAGDAALVLRLSASPALTLAVGGEAVATVGEGAVAWPPPADAPDREWDRVDAAAAARAVADARASGSSPVRAVLEACPGLGPPLARVIADGGADAFAVLRDRLSDARPVLLARGPLDACDDADLVGADALALLPAAVERAGHAPLPQPTWSGAAGAYLQGRLRGQRFDRRRRLLLDNAGRETRRLAQLLGHLEDDLQGLPPADDLRRRAEALLAAGPRAESIGREVEVPDPYRPESRLRIRIDPSLSLPGNADRLFEKARRMERAREKVEARLAQTRTRLTGARSNEEAVRAARRGRDLESRAAEASVPVRPPGRDAASSGPRHYLSSRGLSILVGRGARENHRLTFAVAGPEDVWLHARDVPGAHVIVRDPEGRASAEDLREAAELAAFFSDAARQPQVDVHVTRRKHVRPSRGGPGRVIVGHSETLRAVPRDPDGRLRRR